MGRLIFVDDPLYQGQPPIPQTVRAYAMRSLFANGMSIPEIAAKYGTTYRFTYKMCHPAASILAQPAALKESAVTVLQPAVESAALTKAAAEAAEAADPQDPDHRGAQRRRPGRPITPHTRAELKTWTIAELKRAITNRGLQPGTYAKALEAELDLREPGWYDNL